MDIDEQAAARRFVGHKTGEPCGHVAQPAFAVARVGENQTGGVDVVYRRPHDGGHVVRQGFFALRSGQDRAGRQKQRAAGQYQTAAHGVVHRFFHSFRRVFRVGGLYAIRQSKDRERPSESLFSDGLCGFSDIVRQI